MSKALAIIATISLCLCALFLLAAFTTGGYGAFKALGILDQDSNFASNAPLASEVGTKQWAWDGGDSLEIDAAAIIHYSPEQMPAMVIAHGPDDMISDLSYGGGTIAGNSKHFGHQKLDITVQGVTIRHFAVNGAGKLDLGHIDQDRLYVAFSGAGDARAEGHVDELHLDISGAGNASFEKLAVNNAHVSISGAGNACIMPIDEAHIAISGVGNVQLFSQPKILKKQVFGIGNVKNATGRCDD